MVSIAKVVLAPAAPPPAPPAAGLAISGNPLVGRVWACDACADAHMACVWAWKKLVSFT